MPRWHTPWGEGTRGELGSNEIGTPLSAEGTAGKSVS